MLVDILCSLGLLTVTKFTIGSSCLCFILNSWGESRPGADCFTCKVDYLPLTSFQLGHHRLCAGDPHLGAPKGGDGDRTAQAEQLLQSQGILGTELPTVTVEAEPLAETERWGLSIAWSHGTKWACLLSPEV